MDINEIRIQMKNLWKKTFGDSDEYIELIFSTYFNKEYIEYRIINDQIVAAMLAIPYNFNYVGQVIKGLYLCGLATSQDYRGQGIMSELIESINNRFSNGGITFSFLIPAEQSLIKFYQNKGYQPLISRLKLCLNISNKKNLKITKNGCCNIEKKQLSHLNILDIEDRSIVKEIAKFITTVEPQNCNNPVLLHSNTDITAIIKENELSKGKILYIKDRKDVLKCVVIFNPSNDNGIITIPKIYYSDQSILNDVLRLIIEAFKPYQMNIYLFPEEKNRYVKIIESLKYFNFKNQCLINTYSITQEVYGMTRIINENEISKFSDSQPIDLKYSILTNTKKGANSDQENKIRKSGTIREGIKARICLMLD